MSHEKHRPYHLSQLLVVKNFEVDKMVSDILEPFLLEYIIIDILKIKEVLLKINQFNIVAR